MSNKKNQLSVAIAGSTNHTLIFAKSLQNHPNFEIPWILTPAPKPVGRKQELRQNPLHKFALQKKIPAILVEKKVDERVQKQLEMAQREVRALLKRKLETPKHNAKLRPDLLLVVDFGYFIPDWLLAWPGIAPVNIHPSALPTWRGSSPGQYVILSGAEQSAVSLIKMIAKFDAGPIIAQKTFTVDPAWTQTGYYQHAFELMASDLGQILLDFSQGKIQTKAQPSKSPTPIAWKIKKSDAFVSWETLSQLLAAPVKAEAQAQGTMPTAQVKSEAHSPLLKKMARWQATATITAQFITRACRAFQPWPVLWTIIPTQKGPKRMKILDCQTQNHCLRLEKVQVEGQSAAQWNQVKNILT